MTKDMKLKFASAIALCSFSVVALVLGTVAWFTAARVKNTGNDSINVVCPSGILKQLTIHTCANIDGDTYQFDQTAQGTIAYSTETKKFEYSGNTNVSMGVYDLLDRHHPVLLLVELQSAIIVSDATPVTIAASTNSRFVGESTSEHPVEVDGNPLSSVVETFSYGYTRTDLNAISITNGYSYVDAETSQTISINTYDIPSTESTTSFVNFENDVYTGFDNNISIYRAENGITVQYVAVVFDFFEEALEYIYNTFLGDEILEDRVGFYCDWEMII